MGLLRLPRVCSSGSSVNTHAFDIRGVWYMDARMAFLFLLLLVLLLLLLLLLLILRVFF